MRTALVLGAGGYVGQAFHLGVLTALHELAGFDGRQCEVLVGTSAGSLVAAGLAGGLSAHDLAAEILGEALSTEGQAIRAVIRSQGDAARTLADPPVRGLPSSLRRRGPLAPQAVLLAARHPFTTRPGAVMSGLLPAGRATTDPIARSIRRLHGDTWPERDLRICAVRARDARRVVFGTHAAPHTDVGTAVAASCAIPWYFTPVRIDGHAYVDGGVHSPTNADVLRADALDLVVVLSPMSVGREGSRRPRTDLGLRLAMRRYLAVEVRRLRKGGAHVVVVQPSPQDLDAMGLNPMRGSHIDEVVRAASDSMRLRLRAQPALLTALAQR